MRHSFCSHLAMRGAPAKAIQELAGHRDLSTTQRYMHLSPAAVEGAIRLLEQPAPVSQFGDILETGIQQESDWLQDNKIEVAAVGIEPAAVSWSLDAFLQS